MVAHAPQQQPLSPLLPPLLLAPPPDLPLPSSPPPPPPPPPRIALAELPLPAAEGPPSTKPAEAAEAQVAAAVSDLCVLEAFQARTPYLLARKDDISMRALRRLLESDLRLPEKALDREPHKALVAGLVDRMLLDNLENEHRHRRRRSPPQEGPSAAACPEKRRRLARAADCGATAEPPPESTALACGRGQSRCPACHSRVRYELLACPMCSTSMPTSDDRVGALEEDAALLLQLDPLLCSATVRELQRESTQEAATVVAAVAGAERHCGAYQLITSCIALVLLIQRLSAAPELPPRGEAELALAHACADLSHCAGNVQLIERISSSLTELQALLWV